MFDSTGRRIATLSDGARTAGHHATEWDGRGGDGRRVANGIYFARVAADREVRTVKLSVLR